MDMDMTVNPNLWPSLGYHDAPAAVRFLVEGLGFDEVAHHPGTEPGRIDQAVLRWQDGSLITLHSAEPDIVSFTELGGHSPVGIYLCTEDPDALYDRAVEAGGRPTGAPADSPHGTRDATITDPEGFSWSFGNYRGD
ncbi:MAG: VOC family protein [Microlunatus sp.]|nr:VOC family protein [Microlunatus sp.]